MRQNNRGFISRVPKILDLDRQWKRSRDDGFIFNTIFEFKSVASIHIHSVFYLKLSFKMMTFRLICLELDI